MTVLHAIPALTVALATMLEPSPSRRIRPKSSLNVLPRTVTVFQTIEYAS